MRYRITFSLFTLFSLSTEIKIIAFNFSVIIRASRKREVKGLKLGAGGAKVTAKSWKKIIWYIRPRRDRIRSTMCLLSEQHIFMYLFFAAIPSIPSNSLSVSSLHSPLSAISLPFQQRTGTGANLSNVKTFLFSLSVHIIPFIHARLVCTAIFFQGPARILTYPRALVENSSVTLLPPLCPVFPFHIFFRFWLLFFICALRADFPVLSMERYYARVRLCNKSVLT